MCVLIPVTLGQSFLVVLPFSNQQGRAGLLFCPLTPSGNISKVPIPSQLLSRTQTRERERASICACCFDRRRQITSVLIRSRAIFSRPLLTSPPLLHTVRPQRQSNLPAWISPPSISRLCLCQTLFGGEALPVLPQSLLNGPRIIHDTP